MCNEHGQANPHRPRHINDDSGSSQTEGNPQHGLPVTQASPTTQTRKTRQQWTKEQYKEVMWSYYYAKKHSVDGGVVKGTYTIWRNRNPDIFLNINKDTLANQRRFIISSKKLTEVELAEIKDTIDDRPEQNEPKVQRTMPAVDTQIDLEMTEPNVVETEVETCVLEMQQKIETKMNETRNIPMTNRRKINKIRITKHISQEISNANKALKRIVLDKTMNITEINELMYAAAVVIAGEVTERAEPRARQAEPKWKTRIKKTIDEMRKDLSILSEIKKGVASRKVHIKAENIFRKTKTRNVEVLQATIQMKVAAKAQRIRRYTKRNNQYWQNKLFNEDSKKLYRRLNKQNTNVTEPPTQEQVNRFWREILEDDTSHNDKASWIHKEKASTEGITATAWAEFTVEEIVQVIKKTSNWKAPGPDNLQNFWIKQFTVLHQNMTMALNSLIRNPENTPNWLTTGTTYLLSKGNDTKDPKNYRPITCLPTIYKILTATITNRMYSHLEKNKIIPAEQKGCSRGSRGCKDQLLVSKMIMSLAKKHQRNLSMAWVDYKKAFDSIPHSWIIDVMDIYHIPMPIMLFVKETMKNWRTEMWLYHESGNIRTGDINIKRGIFQGDSLSPLLFCLSLVPLTNMLNRQGLGYDINGNKVNHLFYMDDLKLFAKDEYQLQQELSIVKTFSDDIKMEFGLDKCARATFKRGKLNKTPNIHLADAVIKNLEPNETYKYLGVHEGDNIDHSTMKEMIAKEYYRRVRQVLNTELNSKNKVRAINTFAVPMMSYSFGIIEWKRSEIEKIDRKTRKLLTIGKIHHPRADVDRLYIKRRNGGRGLIDLESAFDTAIVNLSQYIQSGKDRFTTMVKTYDESKAKYSLSKGVRQICDKYNMTNENIKSSIEKRKIERLQIKPLHGQFYNNLSAPNVDKEASIAWLNSSGLKGETESLLIAAQDQALNTRYHQRKILKQQVNSQCRLCGRCEEHISHIISGCGVLAPTEYTYRHNKVAAYIHWLMCKHLGASVPEKWYEHHPETVTNTESTTITWDMPIQTDRLIPANRPDIVVHDKENKTCLLIDVSIPDDANIALKEAEKISKYQDLKIEVNRMWGVKTQIVPVIIGALGTIKKGINKNLALLPGQPDIRELQKTALLGTAHILRKVLG